MIPERKIAKLDHACLTPTKLLPHWLVVSVLHVNNVKHFVLFCSFKEINYKRAIILRKMLKLREKCTAIDFLI